MTMEKIKTGLLGVAGGAVVLAIVGFTWGGWVMESTAQQMAEDAAEEAVTERLASICVNQYEQDPEKTVELKEMKEINSWNRYSYVTKKGWATMPGEKDSNDNVARECADRLSKLEV